MTEPIRIYGLAETRARLKRMGDVEKTREYRQANYDIAATVVVPAARAKASTRMERRAAQTLEPVRSATGGSVRLGKGFPGALGAEFGADRNQNRRGRPHGKAAMVRGWNQFKPWRGSDRNAGYFLWPAIRDQEPKILNRYADMFEELFGDDGPGGGEG